MATEINSGPVLERTEAALLAARLRAEGKTVVFTNGCFDLLHVGHVEYLEFARRQGDVLFVGLNSDASVRRAKGPGRPINKQEHRARLLAALRCVDYVTIFDEDEPRNLIAEILPDVLVKGKDWAHYVSGRDIVEGRGGKVVLSELVEGCSTSRMIQDIVSLAAAQSTSDVGDKEQQVGRSS